MVDISMPRRIIEEMILCNSGHLYRDDDGEGSPVY